MLQETHAIDGCEKLWAELSGAHCFYSHGSSESKGVATLIPVDLDVKVNNVVRDDDGRFLLLDITFQESCFILLNTYAPTKEKPNLQIGFIEKLPCKNIPSKELSGKATLTCIYILR